MFDSRIYRAALLPAVAAFVLLMFSLEPLPNALPGPVSSPSFEGVEAAKVARRIVARAPSREPGSEGDRIAAEVVRDAFSKIEGGEVATQDFSSKFRESDVDLQNVVLTIPGASDRTLLIVAHRDSAAGPGAATSAAATAELIGLADDLGTQRHERTIILASTDGGSEGATGARKLIDALPRPGDIDAAVVLSQPGVADPSAPFVISSGTGPESASTQLLQTARGIAADAFGERDTSVGTWVGLSRLALPIGLGEQVALRGAGIEAIALSAAGERQIPADEDGDVSSDTLAASGTAALDLILTLDGSEDPPEDGPSDYVRLGDNLIPGWTIALLALALVLAPLLTAADTWLREQRADWRTRRTGPWAIERALMPLAALLLAYVLGFVDLIPGPGFPYDPADFAPGAKAPIAFLALAAAVILAGLLIRPMRTPLDSEAHTLAAAAGLVTGAGLVGLWLVNPYMALLLAPAGHVWLLPARAAGPPRPIVVAAAALLSTIGALAALVTVAAQLDLGLTAPWHLLLLIVDGGIGFVTCLLCCLIIGGLIACVSATGARRVPVGGPDAGLRGAGSHVGPGALGSIPGAEARHR
ncbi:MAG: M28 family peptidase [Solirubrobacterales bacterium]|nr:M28 family peptidase [Solirubrobacterales bacterium]